VAVSCPADTPNNLHRQRYLSPRKVKDQVQTMFEILDLATGTAHDPDLDAQVAATHTIRTGRRPLDTIARLVLQSALEHAQARHAMHLPPRNRRLHGET